MGAAVASATGDVALVGAERPAAPKSKRAQRLAWSWRMLGVPPSCAFLWRRQRIDYSRGPWWSLFVRRAACRAPISVWRLRATTEQAALWEAFLWTGRGTVVVQLARPRHTRSFGDDVSGSTTVKSPGVLLCWARNTSRPQLRLAPSFGKRN